MYSADDFPLRIYIYFMGFSPKNRSYSVKSGEVKAWWWDTANSTLSADVIYGFLIFQTFSLSFTWQFITKEFSCFLFSCNGAWTNKPCARGLFPQPTFGHGCCFSSPDLTRDINWILGCIVLMKKAHHGKLNWWKWVFVLFCLETVSQSRSIC